MPGKAKGIDKRLQTADEQADAVAKLCGVAGASIAVLRGDGEVHYHTYGFSNIAKETKAQKNTIYGIGSITEGFVALAMTKAMDAYRLDIIGYESEKAEGNPLTATMTDMLSHRVGFLADRANSWHIQDHGKEMIPQELVRRVFDHSEMVYCQRTHWHHNEWNYALLGEAMEDFTEDTVDDHLEKTVTGPLGLKDTNFRPRDADPARLALAYAAMADGTFVTLSKGGSLTSDKSTWKTARGLFSTAEDLISYAAKILERLREPQNTQGPLQAPQGPLADLPRLMRGQIGIDVPGVSECSGARGWMRVQLPGLVCLLGGNAGSATLGCKSKPMLMLYSQGNTSGYFSYLAVFPDSNMAVVVLTNSLPISDAADWIARIYIQAMFDFTPKQDIYAMAKQFKEAQISNFDEAHADTMRGARLMENRDPMGERAAVRNPRLTGITPRLWHLQAARFNHSRFVGKYVHSVKVMWIYVCAHPTAPDMLLFRFNGLKSQEHELRPVGQGHFGWTMTHDEAKKRGRISFAGRFYYAFRFVAADDGIIKSLLWQNAGPVAPAEVFVKEQYEAQFVASPQKVAQKSKGKKPATQPGEKDVAADKNEEARPENENQLDSDMEDLIARLAMRQQGGEGEAGPSKASVESE